MTELISFYIKTQLSKKNITSHNLDLPRRYDLFIK